MARRIIFITLAVVLLVVLVGPLLIPVQPLTGLLPPQALADSDSRFVDVDGVTLHYKVQGAGEPAMILLHGFSASIFSWREVAAPLAQVGTVVTYDRPASGLTERPLPGDWQGRSPYSPEAQADQVVGLMDALGLRRAILVGNSAGGTIAMLTALRHPDRVQALVLVDAAIYTGGGAPAFIRPLLATPQMERLGLLIARNFASLGDRLISSAWHDPSKVTAEVMAGYRRPLQVQDWDRGLWELTKAGQDLRLPERLAEVRIPTLVITGDDDRIVPTRESVRLAGELPQAELVVLPKCGHVPQEECPAPFLAAVRPFIAKR